MNLELKNHLLSLLQISKTTSQILQIHAQLITANLIADPSASSQLLTSITSPGTLKMDYAELLFTQILQPNIFMYNSMIKGYAQSSSPRRGFHFYVNMRRKGLFGDNYTYPFVLKACRMMTGLGEGREVHGEIVKNGVECDMFVANGLIGMYSRCGEMGWAKMVFNGLSGKEVGAWNLMLGGYVRRGELVEAHKLFDEMPEKDVVSWCIMIDGYGKKAGNVVRARQLFDTMPTRDLVSWNSMIDGYAKAGELVAARQLFHEMPKKNVISWSIMIEGYAQYGNPKEALSLFRQMIYQGMKPDMISVVGAISACAQLGALDQGRWIHTYMKKNRIIMDIVVQTALVDMYMKCGSLDEARSLFYGMPRRNVVTYNAMIVGLGMNGFGEEALECFSQMECEGIPKDDLIFLGTIAVCSHTGLVTEGICIFNEMKRDCRIHPKIEHYSCLVDLLGRAGQLEQALNVIKSMPMRPSSAIWGALLLACRTHHNVALAEVMVERLVELNADDSGVYTLLSNIYADAGLWESVGRTRKLMKNRKLKKETGKSIIEVDGLIKEFVSGETSKELELVIRSFLETRFNS